MSEKLKNISGNSSEHVLSSWEDPKEEQETPVSPEALISPERQEKLKNGIKVVIVGPPHSGKTVFTEALDDVCGDDCCRISATPDGEGKWTAVNYNDPETIERRNRNKGGYTSEFRQNILEQVGGWNGPLLIYDIGGRYNENDDPLIEKATHAVILSSTNAETDQKFTKSVEEWEKILEKFDIPVVAKLHSYYDSSQDIHFERNDYVVGSIHHLERGEDVTDRETILAVADVIKELAKNNQFYDPNRPEGMNDSCFLDVTDFFADLPGETITTSLKNNETITRNLLPSAIPEIYRKVGKRFLGQSVWVDGRMNAWGSTALACAFDDGGAEEIHFNSFNGYVLLRALAQSSEFSSKYWESPSKEGNFNDHPIFRIASKVSKSNPFSPEDLPDLTVPEVPDDSIVVIEGALPNWLRSSIALGYKNKAYAIATYSAYDKNNLIPWSRNKDLIGANLDDFVQIN